VGKLKEFVNSDFERVISVIQQSSDISEITAEMLDRDKEKNRSQPTAQEIVKIRKAVLALLG
jgi:hypothetical protein